MTTGAIRVWGKVGVDSPPYLVLPLTVEPSKPRLCLDARFLNLWMKDMPFSLDKLADVSRYIYKGSFMTKCDDKSGYDHVLLSSSSQTYVGFEFGGFWFVCATLPFGWKISPYIYHTIGLAASGYLRAQGIPCSLYIDDRLNGEILTSTGPWSVLPAYRQPEYRFKAALVAIFCVLSVLVDLGYTIGISKSVLFPTTVVEYLGLLVDSTKQPFLVPKRKIVSWAALREQILACKKYVNIKTLQRFQGKCISFLLAVPAAKLFIRVMSSAIAHASASGQVGLSPCLREELSYWRFLDSWEGCVPWRDEKHVGLSLSTDASGYGWGCVLHLPSGDQEFRDYWDQQQKELNISTKEMLALVNALKALPTTIKNCRIDVDVDSRVLIDAWEGQGSKGSPQLTKATKDLFFELSERNLQLRLSHVKSSNNPVDGPSRRLSGLDSRLSDETWSLVEQTFGGTSGHSFDLMALDSNAVIGWSGSLLPHFTPFPSPDSQGVNLFSQNLLETEDMSNPYVFPPFGLVGPVLKFLYSFQIPFTMVVPELCLYPYWWPELIARSSARICLGSQSTMGVILAPSKVGYSPAKCMFPLWACRVSRF